MDADHIDEICRSLPIFPLPRTVLLPRAMLPLHVFEPRYRALVTFTLQNCGGVFGIATLQPGYEADYHACPRIWPEIGIGVIVSHQFFPDGRCNLVLQQVARAVCVEELPSEHAFRLVRARPLQEDARGIDVAVQSLKLMLLQLGATSAAATAEARRLVMLDGTEVVDVLARKLLEDPDDQRRYLGADRLVDRVALVQDRLASSLVSAEPIGNA